jgi:hypothetical protein
MGKVLEIREFLPHNSSQPSLHWDVGLPPRRLHELHISRPLLSKEKERARRGSEGWRTLLFIKFQNCWRGFKLISIFFCLFCPFHCETPTPFSIYLTYVISRKVPVHLSSFNLFQIQFPKITRWKDEMSQTNVYVSLSLPLSR